MGLRKEHSALQLFNLYEGFFIESRYRAGNPFNEGFLKPDKMGEALILPTVQQMRYVAPNQCWKPMSFSRSVTLTLLGWGGGQSKATQQCL
jgi:hypothetical protein